MGKLTHTYTTVFLQVSAAVMTEIRTKLEEAEYHHVFGEDGSIDMQGISLIGPDHEEAGG